MHLQSWELAAAKAGNVDAINKVLLLTQTVARRVGKAYRINPEDVDDLAQVVCLKLYTRLPMLKAGCGGALSEFIVRLTQRAILDHRKTMYARRTQSWGPDDNPVVWDRHEAIDAAEILDRAASETSTEDVVELAVAGCSQAEIGEKLGIGKRAAQSCLEKHKRVVRSIVKRSETRRFSA